MFYPFTSDNLFTCDSYYPMANQHMVDIVVTDQLLFSHSANERCVASVTSLIGQMCEMQRHLVSKLCIFASSDVAKVFVARINTHAVFKRQLGRVSHRVTAPSSGH